MSELRFRMWSHCMIDDFECVICGEVFEESLTALSLTRAADGEPSADIGDVCLACLEAGPDGVAWRARRHADRLRARALATEALAKELRSADWPTVMAWGAFLDEHDASMHKAMRENDAEIDKAMRENEGGL